MGCVFFASTSHRQGVELGEGDSPVRSTLAAIEDLAHQIQVLVLFMVDDRSRAV